MAIDVDKFSRSVASLDADLVDLDDVDELIDAVDVAAANICINGGIDLDELARLLTDAQSGSDNNELALLLAKSTNVDWLYDGETEKLLKLVAKKLLEGVERYSR